MARLNETYASIKIYKVSEETSHEIWWFCLWD